MTMFEHKQSWIDHEMEKHWRCWFCHLCAFNSQARSDLVFHLEQNHQILPNEGSKERIMSFSSRPLDYIDAEKCLLCDWAQNLSSKGSTTMVTRYSFMDHLASHLKQLALFALPRDGSDESSTEPNSIKTGGGARHGSQKLFITLDGKNTESSSSTSLLPAENTEHKEDLINDTHSDTKQIPLEAPRNTTTLTEIDRAFPSAPPDTDTTSIWVSHADIQDQEIVNLSLRAEDQVQTSAKQKDFLESLWYPEMFKGREQIAKPAPNTFEWIFDDSLPPGDDDAKTRGTFARWLRSDEPLFLISGKAGSGKSTLVSLINEDARTLTALTAWAQDRPLYLISHYLWYAGTPTMINASGLLRSFLYQLATAKPTIVDSILSARHASNDWTRTSLLSAFDQCLLNLCEDRIFIMVDGLDEYNGPLDQLINLLVHCQQFTCCKICVTSRHWNVFVNRLYTFPALNLDFLNSQDIDTFVRNKFAPYHDEISEGIISKINDGAEGRFSWAVLVTRSIVSALAEGANADEIESRLNDMPYDLEELFQHISR